jgi:hypothetical protein
MSFGRHGGFQVIDAHHDPADPILRAGAPRASFGGVEVVNLENIFPQHDEVLIGFGVPNVYTVLPNADGSGFDRFSAFMFGRKEAFVGPVKGGLVQAGFMLRMKGLPPEAASALRDAMNTESGHRHISCARANSRVLDNAGFTSGGKHLAHTLGDQGGEVLPRNLFTQLVTGGIEFQGQKVDFDVITTTPKTMEQHFLAVEKKQATALGRTVKKQYAQADLDPGPRPVLAAEAADLASISDAYATQAPQLDLAMAYPSAFGALLRRVWSPHIIWEASPDAAKVNVDDFLKETLKAEVGGANHGAVAAFKQRAFSPAMVGQIRDHLATGFAEVGSYTGLGLLQALRPHTEEDPGIYNIVITGDRGSDPARRKKIILTGIESEKKTKADWFLSKHVLASNWNDDVRYAGETWVTKDDRGAPTIHLNQNSGTYLPSVEQLLSAARYLQALVPGVPVVAHHLDGSTTVFDA